MTSSDGSGSAHDPVRLSPPADPWLAEAPTSGFGFGETPPPADPTPVAGAAGYGGPPRRRSGRRAYRWVVAVLAACVLFVAGMLAIDRFGPGDARKAAPSAPAGGARSAEAPANRQPSATTVGRPQESATAGRPAGSANEVVYEVSASGSRNTGSVTYTDRDGDIIRLHGITLPWRVTFPLGTQRRPRVLLAQRQGGGDTGPVTCTITVNGKLLSSTTAKGRYASAQCSASG